jgi:release factor glutamine methyltransferase
MKKVSQFIADMREQLSGQYPPNELDSLVHILLQHYLHLSPVAAHLSPDKLIDAETADKLSAAVRQLVNYCPIQYVTGETEFYGLTLKLTPDVLIPRPETEELAEWVIHAETVPKQSALKILDIGTGSGCIAIALAAAFPKAEVWAMDISRPALELAAHNAARNKVSIRFVHADILSAGVHEIFPVAGFDLIVSNPPYVTADEKRYMQRNVLDYEPHQALFPEGDNPLIYYEHIARFGKKRLQPQGAVFFEINELFPKETAAILEKWQYAVSLRKDIHGKWRLLRGGN